MFWGALYISFYTWQDGKARYKDLQAADKDYKGAISGFLARVPSCCLKWSWLHPEFERVDRGGHE